MQDEEYYDLGIAGAFRTAVDKYKNNIAISDADGTLTYQEMYEMSLRIASRLSKLEGWNREVIVAVDLPKSRELILLMMAIYQAGGAFLPIARTSPKMRMISMLQDGRAEIFISDSNDRMDTLDFNIKKVPLCNLISNLMEETPVSENISEQRGNKLAYVMFTSGSTGKPKGIMVLQSSVVHIARACYSRFFGLPEDASIEKLQTITKEYIKIGILCEFSFDPSVVQMYMALFFGHCVVLVPDEVKRSQWQLIEYWKNQKVDMCDITPTHLKHILLYFENDKEKLFLPGNIVSVGEPLSLALLKKLLSSGQVDNVINAYGPTEVCVYCNAKVYNSKDISGIKHVSVGKPLDEYRIYILDQYGKPLDQGEIGEIYTASRFLSLGYIGREDLTQKSFFKDTLESGHMMYKTNDCGKFDDTGELICLGRNDDQIKIRGHRIELSEIENVLVNCGLFEEVHVLAKEDEDSQKQIIAFYRGQRVDEETINKKLGEYLPEYMLPKLFVQVERFITNTNGKLDKADLLSRIEFKKSVSNSKDERNILELCRNVLNNEAVSIQDNFFEQGATSLEVFVLNTRIYQEWGVVLNNSLLYECETIEQIGNLIQSELNKSHSDTSNIINKEEAVKATEFQCKILRSENQLYKNKSFDKFSKKFPPFNVVYRVSHSNYLENEQFKSAIESMSERHRILRSRFYSNNGNVRIKSENKAVTDYSYLVVDDIEKVDFYDYIRRFICTELPLFQVLLFEDRNKNQEILLNFHHGIFDYLSLSIFLNEIFMLYYNMQLPPYNYDFYEYRKELVKSDNALLQEFWNKYLQNRPKSVGFPGDGENKRMKIKKDETFSGIKHELNNDEIIVLRKICKEMKISLFNLTSTVLAQILYESTGQSDICIGTIQHGRMQQLSGVSNSIGLFAELIPLRFMFHSNQSVQDKLLIQQKLLDQTLKNQGLGMHDFYLMQDFEERLKGDYFKVVINYHTDYRSVLPQGKGDLCAVEIGQYAESIPLYIQITEHKDSMTLYFLFADSIYLDSDKKRISEEYLSCLEKWLKCLTNERWDRSNNGNLTRG